MASELSRDELRRLARLGAERRLEELRQEEAAIRAAFPDLGDARGTGRRRRGRPQGRATATSAERDTATVAQGARKRRRRKPLTAAQKRLISERMKKYWAARRKANG